MSRTISQDILFVWILLWKNLSAFVRPFMNAEMFLYHHSSKNALHYSLQTWPVPSSNNWNPHGSREVTGWTIFEAIPSVSTKILKQAMKICNHVSQSFFQLVHWKVNHRFELNITTEYLTKASWIGEGHTMMQENFVGMKTENDYSYTTNFSLNL